MMNSIRKRYILLLTIYSLLSFSLYAQSLQESLSFADKQFQLENYRLALKEYQRVLFFSDDKNIDYLYQQIASIYFINEYYLEAAHNYELAYRTTHKNHLKIEYLFKKAACYILEHKFRMAIFELMNLPDSVNKQYNNRKNFYFGVCYWALEEFNKSKEYFLSIIPDTQRADIKEINLLFTKKRNLYRPNPKVAKIMSMIFPGSGQIYSGDIKNGINSLALTGSFAFLGVYMIEYYTLLDAFLTAVPWFMRYYKGGYRNAEQIAKHKRSIRRDKTYKEIFKIINKNINRDKENN